MLATPSALQSKYGQYLRNKAIPNNLQGMYQKWLRYYLDFCQKYHVPPKTRMWQLKNSFLAS